VECASIRCSVAKKAHRYLIGLLYLRRKRGSHRDIESTAYDTICSKHADREIGDMHRASFAFAVASLPAEQFSHHSAGIRAFCNGMAMATVR